MKRRHRPPWDGRILEQRKANYCVRHVSARELWQDARWLSVQGVIVVALSYHSSENEKSAAASDANRGRIAMYETSSEATVRVKRQLHATLIMPNTATDAVMAV